MKPDTDALLHVFIAILLPPVAVFLRKGVGMPLLISVVLTAFGLVPGSVYAVLIVLGKISR